MLSGTILLLLNRAYTSAVVPPLRQKAKGASPLEFSIDKCQVPTLTPFGCEEFLRVTRVNLLVNMARGKRTGGYR